MCTVSMVAQDWGDRHPFYKQAPWYPSHQPFQPQGLDPNKIVELLNPKLAGPTREEFDALKAELEALKKLLLAAKEYDKATGQPDCESDEKTALFKRLAELVGIDLSEVFAK